MSDSRNGGTPGKGSSGRPNGPRPTRPTGSGTGTGRPTGSGTVRPTGNGTTRPNSAGTTRRVSGASSSQRTSAKGPGSDSLKARSRRKRKKTPWEKFCGGCRMIWKHYRVQSIIILALLALILICLMVKCSTGGSSTKTTPTPTPAPTSVPTSSISDTPTETGSAPITTDDSGIPVLTDQPADTDVSTVTGSELVPETIEIGACSSVTTDTKVKQEATDGWEVDKLMLVNWTHVLKYSGDPEGLVNMTDYMTDSRYHFDDKSLARGNKEAVIALNEMCVAAMNAGCSDVKFSKTGTYRTYETQNNFWQNRISSDPNYGSDPYSNPTKTVPGNVSEHRTGLGFDIWLLEYDYDWLHDNCYKYGFILRYPSDKKGITGIIYEQWHFRYVGVEAATEMHELGFCLEEYIAYKNGAEITPYPTKKPTSTPKPATATPSPTPAAKVTEAVSKVQVPNLSGMTAAQAEEELKKVGLVGNHSEEDDENSATVPAGQVIGQLYSPGTELDKGSMVDYYLSLGPAAVDTPTPAPTDTPVVADTPTPTATPVPADTPIPTKSDTPTPEATATATPTPEPTATPTPEPTATPTPIPEVQPSEEPADSGDGAE